MEDLEVYFGRYLPQLFFSILAPLGLFAILADDKELMEACSWVGLASFVSSLPMGLNTPVGEHGVRLSGGQKQKVALARAMLRDTPVYVFDEATANVDATGEEQIWQAIQRLAAGMELDLPREQRGQPYLHAQAAKLTAILTGTEKGSGSQKGSGLFS